MKKNIILTMIIICLIPLVVLSYKYKAKYFLSYKKNNIEQKENNEQKIVKLKENNEIKEIPLEDYVIGVVACEMPASFHIEALKVQAVASRTYALKKMNKDSIYDLTNSVNDQCYINENKMKEKWNNEFNKYFSKINQAVNLTKGEYITYNDEIITAFYFAMSNGMTENSEMVFKEELPYIKSVESKWETTHKNFINNYIFTEQDFLNKLNIKDKKINLIKVLNRTNSNRIYKIKINNHIFKGTDIRKLLNLKSTDFNIVKDGNKIKITTKGYGHGVGISQYGANGLANENKNYKEIINYYYKDVKIKSIKT